MNLKKILNFIRQVFGNVRKVSEIPQNENTKFYPRSPLAAKLYAHWVTVNYREAYNIFGVTVFYLTTKVPEGETFVTKN